MGPEATRTWWARWWSRWRGLPAGAREGTPTHLDQVEEFVDQGCWIEAAALLAVHLRSEPQDAKSLRELARVAMEMWRWNGSFLEPPAEGVRGRFCSLKELGDGPHAWIAEEPLRVARDALERAVELAPERLAWRAPLGQVRALAGEMQGAAQQLTVAAEQAKVTDRPWQLKSKHLWEFELERVHHQLGAARVDDPLFEARLEPVGETEPGATPAGFFHADFTHQGLDVRGFVTSGPESTVELLLDGRVVRSANVARYQQLPRFAILFPRPTLETFPAATRLEVRTDRGELLLSDGRSTAVTIHLPWGKGTLASLVERGIGIDKKGMLTRTAEQHAELASTHLALYRRVADWFEEHTGTPLFVLYGSLLGIYRDGDLIPGDDDFDVAYVADAHDPGAVKRQALQLIRGLACAGFTVSVNPRGRLFRVHPPGSGASGAHLDVHPMWFQDDRLYVPNHVVLRATRDDFLPSRTMDLRGEAVQVPKRPEVFLEGHYGASWRVPDPAYVEDSSRLSEVEAAIFRRALLTPAEQRSLADEIDRDSGPQGGRFVSIASQPLYPLDDVIE
jgi:hypothetical protein